MSAGKLVPIVLDKERHFRLTMNSLIKFQEVTGKDLVTGSDTTKLNLNLADLRALMWACLIHEDKGLTLEQVGDMIDLQDIDRVSQALAEALQASLPQKEGATVNPPGAQTT